MPILHVSSIQSNPIRRGEYVIDGRILEGCSADIEPGVSIRIYGTYHDGDPKPFDKTFRLGDSCEYDSYNLKYTGVIVSIGPKTVVVDDNGTRRRLTLYDFTWRNWDFDAAAIADHNANERIYI